MFLRERAFCTWSWSTAWRLRISCLLLIASPSDFPSETSNPRSASSADGVETPFPATVPIDKLRPLQEHFAALRTHVFEHPHAHEELGRMTGLEVVPVDGEHALVEDVPLRGVRMLDRHDHLSFTPMPTFDSFFTIAAVCSRILSMRSFPRVSSAMSAARGVPMPSMYSFALL